MKCKIISKFITSFTLILFLNACAEDVCYECTTNDLFMKKKITTCEKEGPANYSMDLYRGMGYKCYKVSKSSSNSITFPENGYEKQKLDSCGCLK